MRGIDRLQTLDPELRRVQENLLSASRSLVTNPLLDGRLLEGVVVGTSSTELSHGLGRKLRGWFPTRRRADARVWDTQDGNTRPELTLLLTASAAVTLDLWVY
jgi:hypothetical protein